MGKSTVLLSICIPTYNGASFITENLESIVNQWEDGIEVVIADENSTDNTLDLIENIINKYPDLVIKVVTNKQRLGFDKNVLNVASLAKGKYCWLFGQDDLVLPGAIEEILETIKRHPDSSLIYCNYERYDNVLKRITADAMIGLTKDKLFFDAEEFMFTPIRNSYFKFLGTNIITMSTDIVNRKLWLKSAQKAKKHIGHNFIHCFVITKMIKANPKIVYLGKPQLRYRSKNERVWPNDIWKDYNEVFINYLISLGYNKEKALGARRAQKTFEKREAAIKHPLLKYVYRVAKPAIGVYRMVKLKLSK